LPLFYGAPSTVHDRFKEWRRSSFFKKCDKLWPLDYDNKNGLKWEWQAIDDAMTKAPFGGAGTESKPTIVEKKVQKQAVSKLKLFLQLGSKQF